MRLRDSASLVTRTVRAWNDDNLSTHAAALSYYTAFSIAPLLVIAIAVAGLVFGEQAADGRVSGQLVGLVGKHGARAIETMMAGARSKSAGVIANILGILALLLGASGVFVQLHQSLNLIWRVEIDKTQGLWAFLRGRLLSFGLVLSVGFLLLVSLVMSAAIAAFGGFLEGRWPGAELFLHLLSSTASFGLITLLFAMILKFLPDRTVEWRDVWPGSAVTALLFTVGKLALALYLGKSGVGSIYGAAASLGIVLLWVYYSSNLILAGAEFTRLLAESRAKRTPAQRSSAPAPDWRDRLGPPVAPV